MLQDRGQEECLEREPPATTPLIVSERLIQRELRRAFIHDLTSPSQGHSRRTTTSPSLRMPASLADLPEEIILNIMLDVRVCLVRAASSNAVDGRQARADGATLPASIEACRARSDLYSSENDHLRSLQHLMLAAREARPPARLPRPVRSTSSRLGGGHRYASTRGC